MFDTATSTRSASMANIAPSGLPRVALIAVVGALLVCTPILSAFVSLAVAFPISILLAFCLAYFAERETPAVLIFATTFQNLFVSILSPLIPDGDSFNLVRGFVFLDTVVVWLVLIGRFLVLYRDYPAEVRRFVVLGLGALATIGLFAGLGLVIAGSAAIIYTRNIATPILLFHIALLTASRARLSATPFLIALTLAVFACGYLELLDRPAWLALTNGRGYWALNLSGMATSGYWENELKQTGFVYRDLYDYFRVSLFNTSYLSGIEIFRLHGPNIHAISFGYTLAFGSLFLFASGRRLAALLALPLLVFASAKGAMLEILFVGLGWSVTALFGARSAALVFGLVAVAYCALLIVTGLAGGDYHVIGLMGGLKGFAANPIGHGIGVGGNLNASISLTEWQQAQATGAFDGAVESAVGVLLYQMGIAALAVIGYYGLIARSTWRLYARSGLLHQGLAAWGTLAILVNGIFQEEALFAPLAMGLMVCFSGIVIGSALRQDAQVPAS